MRKLHEITWVAGILEGEGYFCFDGGPKIQLEMTDLDTIEKYKRVTKTTKRIYFIKSHNENHNDKYAIHLCGIEGIQWMMTIYSLMSSRRKEAIRKVIGQWHGMRNRNSDLMCKNGHMLTGRNKMIEYTSGVIRCRACITHKNKLWRWGIKAKSEVATRA